MLKESFAIKCRAFQLPYKLKEVEEKMKYPDAFISAKEQEIQGDLEELARDNYLEK